MCEGSEIITAALQNSEYALSIFSSESTDAGRKASGLHEVLSTFKFFFGLMLIEKVLEPVETLSSILQSPNLSLNEAKSAVANVTKKSVLQLFGRTVLEDKQILMSKSLRHLGLFDHQRKLMPHLIKFTVSVQLRSFTDRATMKSLML